MIRVGSLIMGALKHRHTETQTPTHRRPTLHCRQRCGNNEGGIAQIASKRNFETFELRQLAKLSGQQRRLYSLTKKVRRRTHVIHIIPMGASCMLYLCQIYKFSVTFICTACCFGFFQQNTFFNHPEFLGYVPHVPF